ncbi:LOW QUALITY PROTEIN: Reverse transcriptase [Phytophthora palmivora]|uniref:Reverse transcriptase n=1 Tax=Phytophthora palmivora TaxID=4796 RepID=A0A2P4XTY9_9STRA|nr:LOW QUALITY PROTEIN: Reverse transcriptase [Phytophthora palmivora]
MRSGKRTRCGRTLREFLVHWKGYDEPTWVDEADLNCGALLYDYLRDRTNRNRFEVMQSQRGHKEARSPLRTFAQTHFDDIFVHSRAEDGQTTMEGMRANKLYANIDKCVFVAEEIKVLGFFGRRSRRSREGQGHSGLANLKVTKGPPEVKDAEWVWENQHQHAFSSIKASLQQAPVLALPDENKSFSVLCDASDYAIGYGLLQMDDE